MTKRERKLHLRYIHTHSYTARESCNANSRPSLRFSYELPHRIHSAQLYPVPAPNGSSVLIYGHGSGLRILWRGGRRRKEIPPVSTSAQPNGTGKRSVVIVIDDDEDEARPEKEGQDELFEEEEEELDTDCPYPSVIQDVDVMMDTQVLHVTVPSFPASALRKSDTLSRHAAIAVSCSDGTQRVVAFDLLPPTNAERADWSFSKEIPFPSSGTPCSSIAAKIIPADRSQATSTFLLVAAVSDTLRIYRFALFDELTNLEHNAQGKIVQLPHCAVNVAFHPSASSSILLVSEVSGAVRIYDPFAPTAALPDESAMDIEAEVDQLGKWLTSFTTSFVSRNSAPARRKRILDAKFILSGKAVLVLLEDGEWGAWDLAATGKSVSEFALHGFLGATAAADSTQLGRQPKSTSRLAPMTPNTRKVKAENLFGSAPKAFGAAIKGGISISASSSKTGTQTDESVVLWYGADIYTIPSLQTFWQRGTSNNGGNSFGSLYTPGLTHITDVNLLNEAITSIAQFAPTAAGSGFGQMNTQRDFLVAAEHRFIVLQTLRPLTPTRGLFQQAAVGEQQRPAERDQRMLDAGQLDLCGMDRMLDGMAHGEARTRRVGFAAH